MPRSLLIVFVIWLVFGAVAQAEGFAPQSLAYVLQADKLARTRTEASVRLAECGRDLIVIDPNYSSGPDVAWSPAEIDAIRRGKPGRRVVAYLSIGEAENYRPYWRRAWTDAQGRPTAAAPKFLGPVNPDWPGNFRVKYWQAEWQSLVLPTVDGAIRQGFDGLYLDIVDGFEFFEFDPAKKDYIDDRKNPETGHTYRQDMIAWVQAVAARARAKAGPGFLVIPQNATQLLADAAYCQTISAVGVEDLFTNGNKKQPHEEVAGRLRDLQAATKAHRPVLVIEYGTQEKARAVSRDGARQQGFVLLLTDRNLTGRDLAPAGGHRPDAPAREGRQ